MPRPLWGHSKLRSIHQVVREGQRVAQIGPDIACAGEGIGVNIDSAGHVLLLAGAKMQHFISYKRRYSQLS